jgi:hypothetical protein
MKPIDALKRFVIAKEDEGTPLALEEIRSYAEENAGELGEAFGKDSEAWTKAIAAVDNANLPKRILATIKDWKAKASEKRVVDVGQTAQKAADAVGAAAVWEGDRATIDLAALLSGALSAKDELLEFTSPNLDLPSRIPLAPCGWTVRVPQAPLFRFKALKKLAKTATAYVDRSGLHVRWGTGGLNLVASPAAKGWTAVVNLPVRAVAPSLAKAGHVVSVAEELGWVGPGESKCEAA